MSLYPFARNSQSRLALFCLCLIMLFGALVRTVTLDHESVEGDELFSRRVALMPVPIAYEAIREDLVHPPLYYFMLKIDTAVLGSSALDIRALSLLFGILSIGMIGYLGTKLPGTRYTGFLAALLMAVNQYQIFFSQQARSYAFYTFLVTSLALWIYQFSRRQAILSWVVGTLLMTALVYTHYVGSIYIIAVVLTLVVCSEDRRTKIAACAAGVISASLFVPWLITIYSVYKAKHGIGSNLNWQGVPTLYDLKMTIGNSIGLLGMKGGTTLVFLLLVGLVTTAMFLVSRNGGLRKNPLVTGIFLLAFIPPLVVFLLSRRPFDLPLFGLRHILPSLALLCLLSVYGLEQLYNYLKKRAIWVTGSALLFSIAAIPTATALRVGVQRCPYSKIATRILAYETSGEPTYAIWFYGEGEPVNFYCRHICVSDLPANYAALPDKIVLLYRPVSSRERRKYNDLLASGYKDVGHTLYFGGVSSEYGTMVTELVKY